MKLLSPLQQAVDRAQKGKAAPHQVIVSADDGQSREQAQAYARALIAAGVVKDTPREFDCNQPTSDHMLQEFFKQAKNALLIFTGISHLARQESFVSLAARAVEKQGCTLVLCGAAAGTQNLLSASPGLARHLPAPIDMDSGSMTAEITAIAQAEKDAALKAMTDVRVKDAIKPMARIQIVTKTPRP
jgi:hypothetical protein